MGAVVGFVEVTGGTPRPAGNCAMQSRPVKRKYAATKKKNAQRPTAWYALFFLHIANIG